MLSLSTKTVGRAVAASLGPMAGLTHLSSSSSSSAATTATTHPRTDPDYKVATRGQFGTTNWAAFLMRRSSPPSSSPSPPFAPPVQSVPGSDPSPPLFQGGFKSTLEEWSVVSPWHDVELVRADGAEGGELPVLNYVNEIPAGTSAKLEIDDSSPGNPVVQDVKKGLPRWLRADAPIEWNYGSLPQTWENPDMNDPLVGLPGDGDPLDVLELGADLDGPLPVGAVVPVRVLGALALIDEGETDWKVLTVRASLGEQRNSLEQVPEELLGRAVEWYRTYKLNEGKPVNDYALDGKILSAADTWTQVVTPAFKEYTEHCKEQ